jgi:predicted protein tyrosine phosphatase
VHPTGAHVRAILDFARNWDRRAPLLIHSYAGISRSPAAAFMTACALDPATEERAIAEALRAATPTASPNLLMDRHTDALLGRAGRMEAAIQVIGHDERAAHTLHFDLGRHSPPLR